MLSDVQTSVQASFAVVQSGACKLCFITRVQDPTLQLVAQACAPSNKQRGMPWGCIAIATNKSHTAWTTVATHEIIVQILWCISDTLFDLALGFCARVGGDVLVPIAEQSYS